MHHSIKHKQGAAGTKVPRVDKLTNYKESHSGRQWTKFEKGGGASDKEGSVPTMHLNNYIYQVIQRKTFKRFKIVLKLLYGG